MVKKEYNVLLLGQTGVGKSSFINGFLNYCSFESIEHAISSQLKYCVPTIFDWYIDNDQFFPVKIGLDQTEVQETGRSATKAVKSYLFNLGDIRIRLVDTPGFGDTDGDDERICGNLLEFLSARSELRDLHAVVVLLKAQDNRMTSFFKYCMTEIFSKFHGDSCQNIAYVFTHTKGTNYKAPVALLKKFLASEMSVAVPCSNTNVFCIDNDCLQFVFAYLSGKPLNRDDKDLYTTSWNKSYSEYIRFVKYIKNLRPVAVDHTIYLNNISKCGIELQKLLPKILQFLDTQEKECQLNLDLLQAKQLDIHELDEELYEYIEINKEGKHLTCGNPHCPLKELVACCNYCIAPENNLCSQISLWTSVCKVCGCSSTDHIIRDGIVVRQVKSDFDQEGTRKNKQNALNSTRVEMYAEEIRIKKCKAEHRYLEQYLIDINNCLRKVSVVRDQNETATILNEKQNMEDIRNEAAKLHKINDKLFTSTLIKKYIRREEHFEIKGDTIYDINEVLEDWKEVAEVH